MVPCFLPGFPSLCLLNIDRLLASSILTVPNSRGSMKRIRRVLKP